MTRRDDEENVLTLAERERMDTRERETEPPTGTHHETPTRTQAEELRDILSNLLDDKLGKVHTKLDTMSGRIGKIEKRLGLGEKRFRTIEDRLAAIEKHLDLPVGDAFDAGAEDEEDEEEAGA